MSSDAFQVMELITYLREDSKVTIYSTEEWAKNARSVVSCNGKWTDYHDEPFEHMTLYGALEEALRTRTMRREEYDRVTKMESEPPATNMAPSPFAIRRIFDEVQAMVRSAKSLSIDGVDAGFKVESGLVWRVIGALKTAGYQVRMPLFVGIEKRTTYNEIP